MGTVAAGGLGGDLGRADVYHPTATSSIVFMIAGTFDTQPWIARQGTAVNQALIRQIKTTSNKKEAHAPLLGGRSISLPPPPLSRYVFLGCDLPRTLGLALRHALPAPINRFVLCTFFQSVPIIQSMLRRYSGPTVHRGSTLPSR